MSGAFGGAYHKDKLDSPSTGSEDGNLGMAGIDLPELPDIGLYFVHILARKSLFLVYCGTQLL